MIENNRYLWSHLKTNRTTLRVTPRQKQAYGMAFQVKNMIDLGCGRQTVILDQVKGVGRASKKVSANQVPFQMDKYDFVCRTKEGLAPYLDVHNVLSMLYKGRSLERIVLDVLSPGDLLVFRGESQNKDMKLYKVLRVAEEMVHKGNKTKSNSGYAL